MKEKVYISGQMTGIAREKYMESFALTENMLKARGYRVVNPTHVWTCRFPWLYKIIGYKLTLLYDLWLLSRCDLIYLIPGWTASRGARVESEWALVFGIDPVEVIVHE